MANICFWIFLAVAANFLLTSAHAANDTSLFGSIFIRLYKTDTTFTDIYMGNESELLQQIDYNKQVVLYIHGLSGSVEAEDAVLVRNAYLMNTDSVVLVADYREAAALFYPIAAESSEDVGKALANILNGMVKSGLEPNKLHVIGHSLGSQVAGYVARNANFRIPRITGLDPAGPLYYITVSRLSSSDAEFVDIIHTDIGFYGLALRIGHADFYPNFGHRPQPGCPLAGPLLSTTDLCSHHRSYKFYAESIKTPTAFIGIKCRNSFEYIIGICNRNQTAVMGYATPSNTRGKYFLQTNAESPYGRGIEGINLTSGAQNNSSEA